MISLIYNKDIKDIESKNNLSPDELELIRSKSLNESQIQQYCHNLFNALSFQYEMEYGSKVMEFVQTDNGDTAHSSLTQIQRIKLGKRKKAEGTKSGWPDVSLFLGTPCGNYSKVILIEFKKIGAPSSINVSDQQKQYHDMLNSIGFSSYITNNTIFFKNHILKEVESFYEEYALKTEK